MTEPLVAIVPAQPGFQIVEPYSGPDGSIVGVSLRPVLAWAITYSMTEDDVERPIARPVSVDDLGSDWAVRHPDGSTIAPFDRTFEADTDPEIISYFEKERLFREECRAKHEAAVEKLADALQRGLSREAAAHETGLSAFTVSYLYDKAAALNRRR